MIDVSASSYIHCFETVRWVTINSLYLSVPKIATLIQGFDARLAKRPFLVLTFGHSDT